MTGVQDVLVIGAGPAGLATASCLKRVGLDPRLVDGAGAAGGAYARMYPNLTLSSPTRYLSLPGLSLRSEAANTSAGDYAAYLSEYSRARQLNVERGRVTRLKRDGDGYLAALDNGTAPLRYRGVVVATGMCESPVIPAGFRVTEPGSGATPVVLHSREWQGPDAYAAERVLIVGSGMRAVEIAEECADAGKLVVVSARRRGVTTFPRRVLGIDLRHLTFPLLRRAPRFLSRRGCLSDRRFPGIDSGFSRLVDQGRIAIRGPVTRFRPPYARFEGASEAWAPELVVLATGYRFETPFLEHELPRARQGYPLVDRSEPDGLPNLFFLGIPCALGADSHFIHGIARDARWVAATIARRFSSRARS